MLWKTKTWTTCHSTMFFPLYVYDACVLYITYRESQTWHSVNVHAMQWTGQYCYKHIHSWKSPPTTAGLSSHVWKAGSITLPKLDLLLLLMWVYRHLAMFLLLILAITLHWSFNDALLCVIHSQLLCTTPVFGCGSKHSLISHFQKLV